MPTIGDVPTMTTLHFRNLPKTERKFIEEAIRELLVKRKLLHISFIGNSVMELLVEKDDSPTIINMVTSARMIYIPNFGVFNNSTRNRNRESASSGMVANMSMLRGRARYCATKADNYAAKQWYWSLCRAANRRLRDLSREATLAAPRRRLLALRFAEELKKLTEKAGAINRVQHEEATYISTGTTENVRERSKRPPGDQSGVEDDTSRSKESNREEEKTVEGISHENITKGSEGAATQPTEEENPENAF